MHGRGTSRKGGRRRAFGEKLSGVNVPARDDAPGSDQATDSRPGRVRMSLWKIAAVQIDSRLGDVLHNLQAVRAGLRDAARRAARLAVFPECVLTGYCFESRDEALPFAEPAPGPSTDALAADCRELGVWAVVGMLERDGDRLF